MIHEVSGFYAGLLLVSETLLMPGVLVSVVLVSGSVILAGSYYNVDVNSWRW